jgi:hypothetical protein
VLRQVIEAAKNEHLADRDIMIDVTGGQKTASIAGASVTLNNDVVFQYVQTGGDPPEVFAYDLGAHVPGRS